MSPFGKALRQSFVNMSASAKLVLLVFIVLVFAVLGSFLTLLLAMPIYHCDLGQISAMIEHPNAENIRVIKFFQIVQSVSLFILPALLAAWLFSDNAFTYLKTNQRTSGITLLLVSISVFVAVPTLNFITELNAQLDLPVWLAGLEKKMIIMEEKAGELTTLFLLSNTNSDLVVNFLMIAILPAIGEEFLFRGILQRLFIDWLRNSHLGIILAAFIFSFIHFQFYGFVPRFLLGLYFGYLMFWSASIWVPVVAHLINNGMAVIYYHFNDKAVGETALDTIGTSGSAKSMVILSTALAIVVIILIYYHEKRRQESFARVT